MQLADLSIKVRERGLSELYDLAIMVFRRHAVDLLVLSLVLAVPMTLLNSWLLGGYVAEEGEGWYQAMLLVSVEIPIYAATITAYLGQAMFSRHPSRRRAVAQAAGRWFALLLTGLLRGVLALVPLLLLVYPSHLVEVLVLERLKGAAAWKRAWNLAAFYRGENILHLLLNAVLGGVLLLLLLLGGAEIMVLLQVGVDGNIDPVELLHPSRPWVTALLCPVLTFCTTLRFCAYLDLRTKREGWEVELELRQAGERLREGGL